MTDDVYCSCCNEPLYDTTTDSCGDCVGEEIRKGSVRNLAAVLGALCEMILDRTGGRTEGQSDEEWAEWFAGARFVPGEIRDWVRDQAADHGIDWADMELSPDQAEWLGLKEKPMKTVKIDSLGLEVDATPVTVGLWRRVMGSVPAEVAKAEHPNEYPITWVSWDDAQEFCQRRGGGWRLLTEEEWETCCRAGTSGDRYGPLDEIAVYGRNQLDTPVGTKHPNPWSLYDMIGLVWERTGIADGSSRVLRGGGWLNVGADALSASYRSGDTPEYRNYDLGLRCARSAKGQQEEPMTKKPCTDPDKMLGACDQNPFLGAAKEARESIAYKAVKTAEKKEMARTPIVMRVAKALHSSHLSRNEAEAIQILASQSCNEQIGLPGDDADILRKAAEIWRDQATEDCVPWGSNGHLRLVASAVDTLADKLEAPPSPKTFTTTWTNADPRPFTGMPTVRYASKDPNLVGVMRPFRESVALYWVDGAEGAVDDDEPWPADLYWTRLPEVDDA